MEPTDEPVAPPSLWYRVAKALPAAVAVLSGLALPKELIGPAAPNYAGLAVSALGIAGTALYYHRQRIRQSTRPAFTLFQVWAITQLLLVRIAVYTGPFSVEEPYWEGRRAIWDTSQFFALPLPMVFDLPSGSLLYSAFNLLPLLFFAWLRRLRLAENIGY